MEEFDYDLMSLEMQHFDDETGEPKEATRMASWPYHGLMLKEKLPAEHFRRSILVSFLDWTVR